MHRRIFEAAVIWSTGALFWEGMSLLSLARAHWLTALLAHLLCALSLGCAAARGGPRQRKRSAISIAVWACCVPVLAPLGLCAVLLPAWRRLRVLERDHVIEIERPRARLLPPKAAQPLPMRELLSHMAEDPSARSAAIMSLRHTELTRAAPLLRMALLDKSEDLRLLAYALLERREKQLRARIEAGKLALAEQQAAHDTATSLALLEQLCSDHFLLATAGFVSGDTAAETLDAAIDYGERALWLCNDAAMRVLLARICLRAQQPERADNHLGHAERLGSARSVLAPLSAHAAFLQGRYSEISGLLHMNSAARVSRPETRGARALWSGLELP